MDPTPLHAAAPTTSDLPAVIDRFASRTLTVDVVPTALCEVETIWNSPLSRDKRVVLRP